MDPTVNPQGTLASINNPLTNAITGANQPQPTATDTAQAPPVNGGASIGQQLMSKFNTKLAAGVNTLTSAGVPLMSAVVASAFHAIDPTKDPLSQKYNEDQKQPAAPQQAQPTAAPQPQMGTTAKIAQGVGGAVNAVGASLGDVAAVGQVPQGGGALTGIARTLGARSQRLAADEVRESELDKNRVMMAEANTRMMHEQKLIHQFGEEEKDSAVVSGNKQLETMLNQPAPSKVIAKNLTSDEIQQYIANNKLDPTRETAVPTGKKVIGEDKNGQPITRLTYALASVPDDVNLDPENPAQKAEIDYLNRNAPPSAGKWGEGGIQHFTGTEYNLVRQQANDKVAAGMAAQRARLQAGFNEEDIHQGEEALNFQTDQTMIKALANAPNGDIIQARNAILADPKMREQYPHLDNDIRQWLGYTEDAKGEKKYVYDKMLQDYQTKLDNQTQMVIDDIKTAGKAHGEEAAGLAKTYSDKADKAADPRTKATYMALAKQAQDAADASMKYDLDKKQQETNISNALEDGDTDTLVTAATNYQLDPNKLYSMRKGQNAEFKAKMLKLDPTWSEAKYKQRYDMQQSLSSDKPNSLGAQLTSLDQYTKHVADANRMITQLQNTNSPWLNVPLNNIKAGTQGFPIASAMKIAMETAKDEYLTFVKAGHAALSAEEQRVADELTTAKTPAELQSAFREMTRLVVDRGSAMNGKYARVMNANIPDMLSEDGKSIIRQFGFDPDEMQQKGLTSISSNINGETRPNAPKPPIPQGLPKDSVYMKVKKPDGTWGFGYVAPDQVQAATGKGAIVAQ